MLTARTAPVVGLAATLLAGCSLLASDRDGSSAEQHGFDPSASMTAAGERLAEASGFAKDAPRYDVRADLAPGTGAVDGRVSADLLVGAESDQVALRYLAGLADLDADARIGDVTVDGLRADAVLNGSILTVELPPQHDERVELVVPFSYRLDLSEPAGLLDALGGMGAVGDVGLLGRHEDVLSLGHWFPLWVPEGNSSEPEPGGYGDIGNFPAALIRADLTVPEGWTVIDGGVRTSREVVGRRITVTTEGYGLRDLAVTVARGYASRQLEVDGLPGVRVTAWAPASARGELDEVLAEASLSMRVLSERFVDYPWRELDVVSTPLAAGVAGMEWPGAIWIESSVFAGGVPGLGSAGELLGDLDGLEELLGGELGRMLATTRLWTLAHEVGHEWWHVVVGNDSVLDPAVDEPLAQYSACLVVRASDQADPDALCAAHISSGYEQMRLMGTPDAAAAQESDAFASSLQYAGVVYGKAAAFYTALEDRLGREAVVDALETVTREHAFAMLTTQELRAALAEELDTDQTFPRMWRRWMTGTRGDQDLGLR